MNMVPLLPVKTQGLRGSTGRAPLCCGDEAVFEGGSDRKGLTHTCYGSMLGALHVIAGGPRGREWVKNSQGVLGSSLTAFLPWRKAVKRDDNNSPHL